MTGALVTDLPGSSSEPPQLDALRRSTRTVTLTIGGNDLGFGQVLASCVYSPHPRLFGLTGFDVFGCRVGALGPAPLYVDSLDVRWIRDKVDGLNAAIRTGVEGARRQGVPATYVDVAPRFTTHNVCGSRAAWVNGVVTTATSPPQLSVASFHPNARGQRAYADAVADTISGDARRRS